jgi:membrane protease YdiL (CAAX protease family)
MDRNVTRTPNSALHAVTRSAPIRLLLPGVGLIVLLLGFEILVGQGIAHVDHSLRPWLVVMEAAIFAGLAILAYRCAVRWLEHRDASELGLDSSMARLVPGAALGVAIFCLVYGVMFATGHVAYAGFGGLARIVSPLAAAAMAAVGEEIVFRGVIFRVVDESAGTVAAAAVSAGLFGLAHAFNPGVTVISTVAIMLEAGFLLAMAYAATRTLWFPIGLHFGWNLTEGGIFGAAVSGGKGHGLFNFTPHGSALWTGGDFGPEASVIAIGACLVVAAGFMAVCLKTGRWKPFRLRFLLVGEP